MYEVKERVVVLETIVEVLKDAQLETEHKLQNLIEEMKNFKEEMLDFKDEMREFKNEMLDFKDEMKEFKEEMKEFKNEMKDFKDEMRNFKREINKKWGEIANKLGTIVEDIVAPNIPAIGTKYFGFDDVDFLMVRVTRKHFLDRSKRREFDVIAIYEDKIILNETKASPRYEYIDRFIEFLKTEEFFKYFPEYKDKKIIPIFSSLYLSDDMVDYLTKNKIYAMAMKDDTMDLLNPELEI